MFVNYFGEIFVHLPLSHRTNIQLGKHTAKLITILQAYFRFRLLAFLRFSLLKRRFRVENFPWTAIIFH